MRLRQGIGRLLRTEDDHGVAVVLDPRLQTRRYGKTILSSLPTDLPVNSKKTADLISITQKFLRNGKEDKVN